MLKKIVGIAATLAVTVGVLGMGYPQENGNEQDTAYLTYPEAVTSRISEETQLSAQTVTRAQTQGARSVARYARKDAHIQDAAMVLVKNRIEASKRKTSLTQAEQQLLQRVVSAEARGESSEAQYTVACVVLNRMESDIFPDTLDEVIHQDGQFTCVDNGAVYSAPVTESVAAAVEMALDNNTLDEDVLWFRSGHYHSFHNRAFRIGSMYFSEL